MTEGAGATERIPILKMSEFPWPDDGVLVMASDGLLSQ